MNHVSLLSLLVFLAFSTGCHRPAVSQSTDPLPKLSPSPSHEDPEQLIGIFVDDDTLVHHGYEVKRLKKKIHYDYGNGKSQATEVSYAVVKRHDRVLAEFDGIYHPAGNSTDFGLFDLLGDKSQQLVVSMTVFRGGRHWVVNFQPEFSVLFDSGDYGVGREEFFVIDVEKDGIYEISLPVTAFYEMQDKMYIAEIPLPEIIFKYDAQQKKYFPANSLYIDYAMRGLDAEMQSLNETGNYLSKRLRVLLRYIYAGKEKEGWTFFDNAYGLPDKEEIEARIKAVLAEEPTYNYLYPGTFGRNRRRTPL